MPASKVILVLVIFLIVLTQTAFSQNPDSIPFTTKVDYETGITPVAILSSDLNGDGDRDLVVGYYNFNSPRISIYLNNGNGTFAPRVNYEALGTPRSIFA